MNFKQYIFLMSISAMLGWLTWGFILFGINPQEAELGVFFLFYTSLLLALSCTLSTLGLIFRMWLLRGRQKVSQQAKKAFRQAILLSLLMIGILYLESKDILSWWIIILFVAVLTLIEFFLISYKVQSQSV